MTIWSDVANVFTGDEDRKAERRQREAEERADAQISRLQGMEGSIDDLTQAGSGMAGVSADPYAIEAQRGGIAGQQEAMRGYRDIYQQGGLTAEDRSRYAQMQGMGRQQERGQREAIAQQMRAQGMAGSGADMASRLAAQQGAASRANTAGLGIEALAQQRRMQALQGMGGMAGAMGAAGGQMRGQSFGESASRATAQDAINRFNTGATERRYGMGANTAGMAVGQQNQYRGQAIQDQQNLLDRGMSMLGGAGSAIFSPSGRDDE